MFSKALVGVDFSPPSSAVLTCLPHLKESGMQEVILGHVMFVANTPGLEAVLENWSKPLLESEATKLEQNGLKVTTDIRMGLPSVTLTEMAEAHDASVIILGTHGRSLLGRVFLGSVATGVLHHTTRPVLLIRASICETEVGPTCEAPCTMLFDNVMFTTDFSDGSEYAFKYLKEIAADMFCPFTLLHVQDETIFKHQMGRLEEFNSIDAVRLERMKSELEKIGAKSVEISVQLGTPAQVIIEQAKANNNSLIVMGTRGRGTLSEIMVGSIAMNVARLSPIPVLLIPMPA